ncbi:MAG: TetR/AcrR family transcriptional regulator [bacterium]|nr:TetR/AcrR family transcriptional regulator [bacterium]
MRDPSMNLREAHKAGRRERILESARQIIASEGHDALTMRALASECGVSVPTIYSLVGGRDDVLFAAVEDHFVRLLGGIETGEAATAIDKVFSILEACCRELVHSPGYSRSLLHLFLTSPGHGIGRRVSEALHAQLVDALETARETGEIVDWVDPKQLAHLIGAQSSQAMLQWASRDLGAERLRALAELAASLLLLGVVPEPTAESLRARARRTQRTCAGIRSH